MAEKPDWFKHENRTDADLSSFAESFLTLFGCKMLESSWRRCMVKEDMEMDPAVLKEFQHDWDRQAPRRCRECSLHSGEVVLRDMRQGMQRGYR